MKAKSIALAVVTALVCASCAMQRLTPAQKLERQQRIAQMVADSLYASHFTTTFDYVIPMRMEPRHLTSPYEVSIKGDTLKSHLPYFGVVNSIPYGRNEGLIFDAHIDDYQCRQVKSDLYRVEVFVNRPEDLYVYTFDVFDNGRTELKVICRNRDLICFTGQMNLKVD